jgi:hypothetical protein
MARRQLEEEYPEAPHPNPSLICPNHFHHGTDSDDENDPKIYVLAQDDLSLYHFVF